MKTMLKEILAKLSFWQNQSLAEEVREKILKDKTLVSALGERTE
jgi:hypothetical protein